jgi:hypothetical protein
MSILLIHIVKPIKREDCDFLAFRDKIFVGVILCILRADTWKVASYP